MSTIVVSPNGNAISAGTTDNPLSLASALSGTKEGDEILMRGGSYVGEFVIKTPGVSLRSFDDEEATFVGPAKYVEKDKPTWLKIAATAKGAKVSLLSFVREGDIKKIYTTGWNDYGIVVEAPDVVLSDLSMRGMAKGIHVKDKTSLNGTIQYCVIGPTVDSCIAVGTSKSVRRGLLIAFNSLSGSLREDAVQFMQDFDLSPSAQETDVSNLGTILYHNSVEGCNENAFDLKGAGDIIMDGNVLRHIGGYSNGYPFDPKLHWDAMSIMHGAHTSTGFALIRNNDIQGCGGGIKVFNLWYILHNLLKDNNYDPSGREWKGTGILQPGETPTARVINNLSTGHLDKNFDIKVMWPGYRSNSDDTTIGTALTYTVGGGKGNILTLEDAHYFTDWFGRKDLPQDMIYVGDQRATVRRVDYAKKQVTTNEELVWSENTPVSWLSPYPVVGIQEKYEGPVILPAPTTETVKLMLEANMSSAEAQTLRSLLAGKEYKITIA